MPVTIFFTPRRVVVWICVLLVAATYGQDIVVSQDKLDVGRPGKDVMWVPSPQSLVEAMLDLAKVNANDVVIDLGSGDGRTVIAAAQRGAKAVGIEYDSDLVELSRAYANAAGVAAETEFIVADLFEIDLSHATVVTMFLLPDLNVKLRPKLLRLRAGTRVVSNTWDLEEWKADDTVVLDPCPGFCMAHLWIVPAQVEGEWDVNGDALTLKQQFQTITGVLEANGESVPISEGLLRGDQIGFRVGEAHYTGRINGSRIRGMVELGGDVNEWVATQVSDE
tara:strand:- start:7252 stop:8088 length:837 start_codon:yes stop_codon:yes gene_type:complete